MASWPGVAFAILLLTPLAAAQANNTTDNATNITTGDPEPAATQPAGDPPYRRTGAIILYLTFAAIGAGLAGSWWVAKRYEP